MLRFVCKQILEPVVLLRQRRFLCTGNMRLQEVVKEAKPQFGQQVSSGKISAAFLGSNNAVKVLFDDNRAAEFKFIWLRDNCACPKCVHPETRQKLLDTPQLDLTNIQARSVEVDGQDQLIVTWDENGMEHRSTFRSEKLLKYGRCFMEERFTLSERSVSAKRPSLQLWDGSSVSQNLPEICFKEFNNSEKALKMWLDMFYRYGIALIRNVPVQKDKIIDVVRRFAYVRETSYGVTFDVVAEPNPEAHLAFTGAHLHHHTDMNYREKSPGMQLLHCLKAQDSSHGDPGGKSFFVDGFSAAEWLRQNEPTAFHLLSAVPVNFQIKTSGRYFSQQWPIICLDSESNICEIHYNNRTMGPLQVPSHLVIPFYQAYKIFTEKIRSQSMQLAFHLQPGDLVAFNNRRILHGRTAYNPAVVSRYLQGCYVDIDEVLSVYDSLLLENS